MDLLNLLWESALEFCNDKDVRIIFRVVGIVVTIIKIATPIILIVVGMLDLAKSVAAKDEGAIKEAQKGLVKKAIAALLVFLVITLVGLIMNFVDAEDYKKCLTCINSPFTECAKDVINNNQNNGGNKQEGSSGAGGGASSGNGGKEQLLR